MDETGALATMRHASVTRFGPGTAPQRWEPGDFILTRGESWHCRLIRTGQWMGLRGEERRFAQWDHAALVVSADGDLVEAIGGRGVVATHARRHLLREYRLVHIAADERAREAAVRFARWAAANRTPYGWLAILSIICLQGTGGRLLFPVGGQVTCSGLVAGALQHTGLRIGSGPSHVTPADLARAFAVDSLRPPRAVAA